MNYTLHQLYIFSQIAEKQSITKAAESLHMTQPAVSIQLKNLQMQFDLPLTETIGRKIYLTEFGRELAVSARLMLDMAEEINFKTQAYKGNISGKLKIASVSTGKYILPYFLTDFLQLHESVNLEMDVTNKITVVQDLQTNKIDMALVSIVPDFIQVESISLLPNNLYLVSNELLFHNKHIQTLSELENVPFIFREMGSGTRRSLENLISRYKLRLQKKLELRGNEAVKQFVLAGLGYSIMPVIGIRREIANRDIYIHHIPELPIQNSWQLIWLKGKKLSPVCRAFVDHVQSHREDIIHKYFSDHTYHEYQSI